VLLSVIRGRCAMATSLLACPQLPRRAPAAPPRQRCIHSPLPQHYLHTRPMEASSPSTAASTWSQRSWSRLLLRLLPSSLPVWCATATSTSHRPPPVRHYVVAASMVAPMMFGEHVVTTACTECDSCIYPMAHLVTTPKPISVDVADSRKHGLQRLRCVRFLVGTSSQTEGRCLFECGMASRACCCGRCGG
jgi:hypothetical protein